MKAGNNANTVVVIFKTIVFSAITEVYKNEGSDEYRKKEFSNAIHLYTKGIKVNCNDGELNAQLYCNRATVHFCLGKLFTLTRNHRCMCPLHN